jgi:hypothetical protein
VCWIIALLPMRCLTAALVVIWGSWMPKHITVLFENRSGQFYRVADTLNKAGVNISAHHMMSIGNCAVLQMVCSPHDVAITELRRVYKTYATEGEIVAVRVRNHAGELLPILQALAAKGLNISHSYCAQDPKQECDIVLLDFEDPDELKWAKQILQEMNAQLLPEVPAPK